MSTIDAEWETMSYTNRLRWWINNVWNNAPPAAPTVEPAVAPEPMVESAVTTEPIVGPVGAESVVEPTVSAESATLAPAEPVIEQQPAVPDSVTHVSEPAAPAETVSATPAPATPAPAPAKHKKHWNKRTVSIQH